MGRHIYRKRARMVQSNHALAHPPGKAEIVQKRPQDHDGQTGEVDQRQRLSQAKPLRAARCLGHSRFIDGRGSAPGQARVGKGRAHGLLNRAHMGIRCARNVEHAGQFKGQGHAQGGQEPKRIQGPGAQPPFQKRSRQNQRAQD